MNKIEMNYLGLTQQGAAVAAQYPQWYPARVISQAKDLYKVASETGELMAEVSGKFRFTVEQAADFPAVGDFVLLDRCHDGEGNAIIHQVLPRKSMFVRKAAGTGHREQVVACNIDWVFICMSLNHDFNLRRLERYLSIGWDSGAVPVIVLTKADLCTELEQRLAEVATVAIGVDVLVTSAVEQQLEQLSTYLQPGKTVAFIGSSGVGKSTLINGLAGTDLETSGLRNDDKGRHTTTYRELILLPNGAMVIDTPGMRELGLESADLSRSFADIALLAEACKFRDCTHSGEPGCAVQQAIASGQLPAQRLTSYQKLKREAKYEGLNSRQIEETKLNEMFSSFGGIKNARKQLKAKNKRR